jgi:hypothetical protein
MKIRKLNTTTNLYENLDAGVDVGPIQMIGSTFIKNLKILINGKEVYDSNSLYAYKSYLDTLLSFPASVKNSYLNVAGYYQDGDQQSSADNPGHIARKTLFAESKIAQFISKIDADLFNQELYLINNTEIDIQITPNSDRFNILAPANTTGVYQLEITQCKLLIKTLELMDGLALEIAKKLDREVARYPVRKSQIKTNHIDAGRMEFDGMLFADQVPRRIILGLVANDAYNGNFAKSPFVFDHNNVREISITANGQTYPAAPYDLDINGGKFARSFHDLHEVMGMANNTDSNGISMSNYKSCSCLYAFNLTNSMEDNACFDLIKNGTTTLNIKFSAAIPAGGLNYIAIGEMDAMFFIDKNRTITTDSAV